MIDYLTNSPFNSPFIQQKGIHVLVLLEYNTRQKQNKIKSHPALIPVPYAGQKPAPNLVPEKGIPRRGEQSSVVIISYKGYSPPKCSYNDQTNQYTSK